MATYKAEIAVFAVFLGCALRTDPAPPAATFEDAGNSAGDRGSARIRTSWMPSADAGPMSADAAKSPTEGPQEGLFEAGQPETTNDIGSSKDAPEGLSDGSPSEMTDASLGDVDDSTIADAGQTLEDAADHDTTVDVRARSTCADLQCGDHGICQDDESVPICECDIGYSGDVCDECADDYQDVDGDGVCTITCIAFPSDCSDNGSCVIENGIAHCDCDTGYTGIDCELCEETYYQHAEYGCLAPCDNAECDYVLGFCYGNHDIVICVCDLDCGNYGYCRVRDETMFCDCIAGYQGESCDECRDGYHMNPETNECLLDHDE